MSKNKINILSIVPHLSATLYLITSALESRKGGYGNSDKSDSIDCIYSIYFFRYETEVQFASPKVGDTLTAQLCL